MVYPVVFLCFGNTTAFIALNFLFNQKYKIIARVQLMKLSEEQELLLSMLRVEKLISLRGEQACEIQKELALIYLHVAIEKPPLREGKPSPVFLKAMNCA